MSDLEKTIALLESPDVRNKQLALSNIISGLVAYKDFVVIFMQPYLDNDWSSYENPDLNAILTLPKPCLSLGLMGKIAPDIFFSIRNLKHPDQVYISLCFVTTKITKLHPFRHIFHTGEDWDKKSMQVCKLFNRIATYLKQLDTMEGWGGFNLSYDKQHRKLNKFIDSRCRHAEYTKRLNQLKKRKKWLERAFEFYYAQELRKFILSDSIKDIFMHFFKQTIDSLYDKKLK